MDPSRFRNYGSSIAVGDKNARSVLQCEDAFHGGYIFLEGRLRLLDDADVIAVLDKVVVNALPARTVRPGTVDEDDIFHVGLLSVKVWPLDRTAAHNIVVNTANRLNMTTPVVFLVSSAARFALCRFYWTHTISTATGWAKASRQFPSLSLAARRLVRLLAPADRNQATEMAATRNIVTNNASRTTKIMTSPPIAFERD